MFATNPFDGVAKYRVFHRLVRFPMDINHHSPAGHKLVGLHPVPAVHHDFLHLKPFGAVLMGHHQRTRFPLPAPFGIAAPKTLFVSLNHVRRRAALRNPAFFDKNHLVAKGFDRPQIVRHKEDRLPFTLKLLKALHALALKGQIADRQHLIDQQHIGVHFRGHRKTEPHVHPAGIRLHRLVDKLVHLRKFDDAVHALIDHFLTDPHQRRVEVHILPATQIRMKARAQLQQ